MTATTTKRTTVGGLLVALTATLLTALTPLQPAQADSSVSCNGATCYVSSTAHARNTWSENPPPSSNPRNDRNDAGESPYMFERENCHSWQNGSNFDPKYPKPPQTGECIHGSFSAGQGTIAQRCPVSNGRSANGFMVAYYKNNGAYAFFYCLYPTDGSYYPTTATAKIYTGGKGDFFKANTKASANRYSTTNGTQTDTTGYRSTGFNAADPITTPPLNLTFKAKTGKTNDGQPLYGFYRLQWKKDYKNCVKTTYPQWMGYPTETECGPTKTEYTAEPYTYACNLNPALQKGINNNAKFRASLCNTVWECSVNKHITVNGTTKPVTTMRDGEPNHTIHNGGNLPTVKNVKVEKYLYKDTVGKNSTPFNGTNPNSNKQYFSMKTTTGTDMLFDRLLPLTKAQQNTNLFFYWASNTGHDWKMTRSYKITGLFNVNTQAGIGYGTTIKPVRDTADCGTATTPPITVVRSANQ